MKRSRLNLPWSLLAGLLALAVGAQGLKATALVLQKLKNPTTSTEAPAAAEQEEGAAPVTGSEEANTTRSLLTGIPQIDYVHDPNLPRELNGYNLTDYPFYDRVPDELDFKCDGLHDGFYASVPHKCQVYHHCLFGTRYDFLCANYTAFDQKTFICHFVSEVDCENSPKYFKRNEALYKAATTTTTAPPPPPPPPPSTTAAPASARRPQRPRRPGRVRRPVYEYYYGEDDYDDEDYYYDDLPPTGKDGGRPRPHQAPERKPVEEQETTSSPEGKPKPSGSLFGRPRVPPKIRPPVPINEREKYDYMRSSIAAPSTETPTEAIAKTPATQAPSRHYDNAEYDYEYDDQEDGTDEEETYTPVRAPQGSRRKAPPPESYDRDIVRRPALSGGRNHRRKSAGGRRGGASRDDIAYDDYVFDDDYRVPYRQPSSGRRTRPKGDFPRGSGYRQDEYSQRGYSHDRRGGYSTRYDASEEDDEEPVPAPRPAYISQSSAGRQGTMSRKRPQSAREDALPSRSAGVGSYKRIAPGRKPSQTSYADDTPVEDDYYDDEEEEVPVQRSRNRPTTVTSVGEDKSQNRGGHANKRISALRSGNRGTQISQIRAPIKSDRFTDDSTTELASVLQDSKQRDSEIQRPSPRQNFSPKDTEAPQQTEYQKFSQPQQIRQQSNFKSTATPQDRGNTGFSGRDFRAPSQPKGSQLNVETVTDARSKSASNVDRVSFPENGRFNEQVLQPKSPQIVVNKELIRPINADPLLPFRSNTGSRAVKVVIKPLGKDRDLDITERQNLADINDHDYDVAINDALHPTLHPVRSITGEFVPQTVADVRTYKTKLTQSTPLISSPSQTYITRTPFPDAPEATSNGRLDYPSAPEQPVYQQSRQRHNQQRRVQNYDY